MATFNFTFDPGTTVQQMIGFEIAGRVWAAYLTDNVTINLQVGVSSSLSSNVIGGALPGIRSQASYSDFYSRLRTDAKSTDDRTAINNLQGTSTYANSWFCTWSMSNDANGYGFNYQSTQLNLTRANAKALGISPDSTSTTSTTALDGYIVFSNLANARTAAGTPVTWSYDFTRQNTQASNSLDFLSTAIHEIGHVLGFTSGVDAPGWLNTSMINTNFTAYEQSLSQRAQNANPLDFFRYSQETDGYGAIDLAIGGTSNAYFSKYFSIDGGTTAIAKYSAGTNLALQGDGSQASHWQAGTNAMMAPTLKTGTRAAISGIDLKAFDVIGWDLATNGINTSINLSTLQTQAYIALATRALQSLNVTSWITSNFNTSPTQLTKNQYQAIYTMMQNSKVYDMTRVAPPSSTGTVTQQNLAQVFEERGLFNTLSADGSFQCGCGRCGVSSSQGLFQTLDEQMARHAGTGLPTLASGNPELPTTVELALSPLSTSIPSVASMQKIARFYLQDYNQSSAPDRQFTAQSPSISMGTTSMGTTSMGTTANGLAAIAPELAGSAQSFASRAYESRLGHAGASQPSQVGEDSGNLAADIDFLGRELINIV
jgi:hypothetical protein